MDSVTLITTERPLTCG